MNSLQTIRRRAGYKSAKEFAKAMGIPVATYTRYEQSPRRIPVERAWAIADWLACSIDEVVGREHAAASTTRSENQGYFDGLSEDGQRLLQQIAAVLKGNERQKAKSAHQNEEERYDSYLSYYERVFQNSLDASDAAGEIMIFGGYEDRRAVFAAFLSERAATMRDRKIDAACDERMRRILTDDGNLLLGCRGSSAYEKQLAAQRLEELSMGVRRQACKEVEAEDAKTIERVMAAFDRKYGPRDRIMDTIERGEAYTRVLLQQLGDVKVSGGVSRDTRRRKRDAAEGSEPSSSSFESRGTQGSEKQRFMLQLKYLKDTRDEV